MLLNTMALIFYVSYQIFGPQTWKGQLLVAECRYVQNYWTPPWYFVCLMTLTFTCCSPVFSSNILCQKIVLSWPKLKPTNPRKNILNCLSFWNVKSWLWSCWRMFIIIPGYTRVCHGSPATYAGDDRGWIGCFIIHTVSELAPAHSCV